MKLRRSNEHAGVLLVVLMTSLILGITLASYLQYTSTQSRSIMRSQLWNAGIPISEAGIEEALAHINDSTIGTNFAMNGWTVVSNQYQKAGRLGRWRYLTQISTDAFPIITATASVTDVRTSNDLARVVRVTTSRWATGMKGIVTRGDLVMVGGTSMDSFDSEDARYSTLGRYDAKKHKDGGYAASVFGNFIVEVVNGSVGTGPNGTATGTVGDFGWTASSSGIEPGHYANDVNFAFPEVQAPFDGGAASPSGANVTLTNFSYWSTMVTTTNIPTSPPPASAITTNFLGTNTVTTYPTWISPSLITANTTHMRTKTDPAPGTYLNLVVKGAWNEYDLITSYSYPSLTYTYSMTATNSSVTTEWYDYVLTQDRYQMSELRMSGGQRLLVLGTNVTMYVKGDFTMTGNSEVIIAPGGSLKMYIAGDISLAGNGIFNYTLDATHFSLFGMPSTKKVDISGNASLTGVIYAPRADITMNGSGNNIYDVIGAIVGNTAKMNGKFQFHYDERLGRSKILSKYSVASWREL